MSTTRVSWKSIVPIFADVVVSPWNLLVGGLLIQHLSFIQASIAIVGGYIILGFIFILYGGLGFKERKQSSELLSDVFGSKIVKYIIPIILAIGQIGWAGVNIDLGGGSFASLFSFPWVVGILVYTVILISIAMLSLSRMALVKYAVIISALSLMLYLFIDKITSSSLIHILSYQPTTSYSLFWGVSIIVASLISFSTVTPDFFQAVKTKNDVVFSSLIGLAPGIAVALLGCLLFYDRHSLDLVGLLSVTSLSFFPQLFNSITNTDGSTAIYTPALKLQSILPINFKTGVILAGMSSFVLSLTHISLHISEWLTVLSLLFPAFIGVCFSAFLFKRFTNRIMYHKEIIASFVLSLLIAIFSVSYVPPVILALVAPVLSFVFILGYTNLSII